MPDKITAEAQNVRKRVLWPLGVTLAVFLVMFLAVFQVYLQRELSRNLDNHVAFAGRLYDDFLVERAKTMQSLISQIRKHPSLRDAMLENDREELLQLSSPIFRELLREQDITHFYYHTPDGVNLLRVHKPERFGDRIDRITMKQARSSGVVASGVELGPLGTFTLRVVMPWFDRDRVIGYIELGEEVDPLIERVANRTGSQMATLIEKRYIDRPDWQEGMAMLGRAVSWELLPDHVVMATTESQLLHELPRLATPDYFSGNEIVDITLLQQHYRGRYTLLTDAGGRSVGVMLILRNINDTLQDHRIAISLVTVFCILLGSVLFASAYTILGRTENVIRAARQKLIDEIEKTHRANIQLGLEITEKKAAEQALREAHEQLEQRVIDRTAQLDRQKKLLENLVSTIPSCVAWKSRERTYIGSNIGYAGLAGITESEIIGRTDAEIEWTPSFRELLSQVDEEVLENNRPVVDRELIDNSPEAASHFLCNAVPLRDDTGRVFGMVSILQDITEQKERERLLETTLDKVRQSNDRMAGVMRSVDDALLVVDADDRILLMNESAGSLLRLNPDELIGKEVLSAIWLDALRDKVMDILRRREGGVAFDFEIAGPDQVTPLVMQARSSVLIDPQGRYEGMIFLARDVTRDRSMDRLKSEFISVAAHELRTPLATILGFSELLLGDETPPESDRQEFVRVIFEKAESLSRLLDDMLDISRIESGRGIELFVEKVPVQDLFMPTIRHYRKMEPERTIETDLEFPDLVLDADPDKISQVMENLLSNAVKYSPGDSDIAVTGKVLVDGYCLTIRDHGIGMTPEQVHHAFDKFYRGDNSDKAIKGTGLGLTIVKHIVEEHGGRIWLESRPGKGTSAHFILPIA